MFAHLRACLSLLVLSLIICCVIYPAALFYSGQALYPSQVEGSLIFDAQGNAIGSKLIAQPFNGDEYFHPRPSAASYNGAASGATNWGSTNYLLRDRVARMLGPIVKYQSGPEKGQPVAPDIEKWFKEDKYQGNTGLVAQWAAVHSTLAANWVKADPLNAAYVVEWQASHPEDVVQWKKDNPAVTEPKPEELAGAFFTSLSKEHPGKFPTLAQPDGSTDKKMELVDQGSDIQSIFFDMWRQDHPDADLEPVPGDMVMASGSGLDPHITTRNAVYQLDRVAGKWAELTKGDTQTIRTDINKIVIEKSFAPLGGLVGVPMVNVLELNLAIKERYSPQVKTAATTSR